MTHVSSSSSWSLESAMAQPHGTGVDQVAVVAFVCQAEDYNLLQPYGIRELCLMDNRLVNSFLSVIHQYCME